MSRFGPLALLWKFPGAAQIDGGLSFGQYIRNVGMNSLFGAGSQIASLYSPGESACEYKVRKLSANGVSYIQKIGYTRVLGEDKGSHANQGTSNNPRSLSSPGAKCQSKSLIRSSMLSTAFSQRLTSRTECRCLVARGTALSG